MDAIYEAGDGDVARSYQRLRSGALDVPFAPSDAAKGAVLPARDDAGRVRIFEFADLALPDDIMEIHAARLGERAETEGRDRRSGWSPMTWTPSAMGSSSGGRARQQPRRGCKRCGLKTFERFQASPGSFSTTEGHQGWGDADRVRLRRPPVTDGFDRIREAGEALIG